MATFGILVLNEQCRPSIHYCQLMVLLIRCKTSSAVPKSKLTNFVSLFQILIKAQKSREKDLIALTGIYVKEGLECNLDRCRQNEVTHLPVSCLALLLYK